MQVDTGCERLTTRIVVAVAIGNAMEWYDFALTAYLASALAGVFFPQSTPLSGLLNVLVVFGIAFFFRPLGGLVLGPLGDRRGRQVALITTFALMAVSTFCVGLLPGFATIGVAAPVLLVALRIVQGFSGGGEIGTAITYLSEHASPRHRGFVASFVQASSIAGFLFASVVVGALGLFASRVDLTAWAWRIPFLLALPFGAIGLYIRLQLAETPAFAQLRRTGQLVRHPIATAFRTDWRAILRIAGLVALQQAGYYTVYAYFPGHLTRLGIPAAQANLATTITLVVAMFLVPAFGALSDVIGRRPVLMASGIYLLILAVPVFALTSMVGIVGAVCLQLLLTIGVAAYNAVTNATYAEYLSTATRSGALSIGFNIGTLIIGAPALAIMTLLNTAFHSTWAPGLYIVVSGIISIVAVATLPARGSVRIEG